MAESDKNIVWISSYPKSGNTWFRVFLDNLLSRSSEPININDLKSTIHASNRFIFDRVTGLSSSDLCIDEINSLRGAVYTHISREADTTVYIKVHDLWSKDEGNKEIFPHEITKGVIYIIRNPFDLVISLSNHYKISYTQAIDFLVFGKYNLASNPQNLSLQLYQKVGHWAEHVISWTKQSPLPVHIVRYEDMMLEPYDTFTQAVEFLGIESSQYKIQEAIRNSSFIEMQKQESIYGFNEKMIPAETFFKHGSINHGVNMIDDHEKNLINKHLYKVLNEFNYLIP